MQTRAELIREARINSKITAPVAKSSSVLRHLFSTIEKPYQRLIITLHISVSQYSSLAKCIIIRLIKFDEKNQSFLSFIFNPFYTIINLV